jgi:hypothetical protein
VPFWVKKFWRFYPRRKNVEGMKTKLLGTPRVAANRFPFAMRYCAWSRCAALNVVWNFAKYRNSIMFKSQNYSVVRRNDERLFACVRWIN